MLVIPVVNLKGGTSKTTTTAFVAHALHEAGWAVFGIDADPQGSLLHWSGVAEFDFPVVGMADRRFHSRLDGVVGDRADAAVVDTPPLDEQGGIVYSALRRATHVVIPVAPTPVEYERLPAVREALAEVASLRASGEPPAHHVLLTRTVPQAASTEVYREAITADGDRVLRAVVPRRERYAQAYGDPIHRAASGPFGDAVLELLDDGEGA